MVAWLSWLVVGGRRELCQADMHGRPWDSLAEVQCLS